jgi:hypothetical protein
LIIKGEGRPPSLCGPGQKKPFNISLLKEFFVKIHDLVMILHLPLTIGGFQIKRKREQRGIERCNRTGSGRKSSACKYWETYDS